MSQNCIIKKDSNEWYKKDNTPLLVSLRVRLTDGAGAHSDSKQIGFCK